MKKILTALMLLALFVSCSSDDDNTDPNNNGNNNGMIDEKILGKWKVEHSKTIKGARYLEDGTLEIAEGAVITEYEGDYPEKTLNITSGMFDSKESKITFTKEGYIDVYMESIIKPKNQSYKIENGYLVCYDILLHKYSIKDEKLTIERIPIDKDKWTYVKSTYTKIAE